MFTFSLISGISEKIVQDELIGILNTPLEVGENLHALRQIFSFLDYTTLEGSDTNTKVKSLCEKAIWFGEKGLPFPAAVCIYPPFIATAKKALQGTPIKVATTAASFPSGQMVLSLKLNEIDYCVQEGADEVDVVISRGIFLDQKYDTILYELTEMRAHCHQQTLKVILETGELQTSENIARASEIAIMAGADFIKTSTGKISPAATVEAVFVMLQVIRQYYLKTGKKIGIKPAGGIAEPEQALRYYLIVNKILGEHWLTPSLFRIGASRLTDRLSAVLLST
ncbi:MAG: deoxyribose-phosphate aldolase [Bacteroidetes bacterium]|nr:deoxyribose-phosphate aldolase [Bacteroidota bacterium]